MKKLFLLCFLFIPILTFAQLEAAWWFFGEQASVDFTSGAPVAAPPGNLITIEGCSSISDPCGVLQMYSDGTTVWDRNGNPMPNGTGLSGDSSSAQSAIIIPDLLRPDRYFLITVASAGSRANGLRYSIIDMNLNGGLGDVDVTRRDVVLIPNYSEKLTAALNDDGTFYWIVTGEDGVYTSFPAAGGIILPSRAVVSNLPVTDTAGNSNIGYLRLSPDASKIATTYVSSTTGGWLMDFNKATGVINNPISLTTTRANNRFYGAEFSPNSQLLYINANSTNSANACGINNNREVLQYQIGGAPNWNSSPFVLPATGANSGRGALQLGIDGKIYHARVCQRWLGVIRSPNSVGLAADYVDDGLALNDFSQEGLPPFITSFFEPSFNSFPAGTAGSGSIDQVNFCDGTTVQFEASTSDLCNTSTISWDFDDGSAGSTIFNPVHTFPAPGIYTVTLIVSNGGFRFEGTSEITIYANPIANAVTDVFLCDSDGNGFETRDLDFIERPQVLGMQTNPDYLVSYHLSQNAANNNVSAIDMPYDFTTGTTAVYARISNNENDISRVCYDTVSFDVTVANVNGASRPNDLINCDDDNNGFSNFDLTTTESEVLSGLPAASFTITYHTSAADAATGMNAVMNPSSYDNVVVNTQRIFIRLSDNGPIGCTSSTEVDLFVWDTPTANTVLDTAVCDIGNDGTEIILLTDFDVQVLGSQASPPFIVSYHLSQAEADSGTNDQLTPYDLTATTLFFVRIDNINNELCFDTTTFTIELNVVPVANPVATYRLCDDISNDNSEVFDLGSRTTQVLLAQVPANFNIEYFTSQAEADQGSVGGATPVSNLYPSSGQTMYVRIENVANTDCFDTNTFDIILDDLPTAIPQLGPLNLCDNLNDGTEDIDLNALFSANLLGSQTALPYEISYHANQADADADNPSLVNPFTINLGTTNIFARIDNVSNNSCYNTTPISIILSEQAIANAVTDFRLCDDMSNDGTADFDLSTKNVEVLGTQNPANFTIEYFLSQSDADLGSAGGAAAVTTVFNSGSTTLFVRIQSNTYTGCSDTEMFDLFVDPLPIPGIPADIIVCDDPSNDGTKDVDLSQYDDVINVSLDPNFSVTYYATQAEADGTDRTLALSSPYSVTSSTPNLFARIENSTNPECYGTTTFRFVISPTPTANPVIDLISCDDVGNDGSEVFDLSTAYSQVLNGQTASDFNITFHTSQNDADMNVGGIASMYTSSATTPETIFIRIETIANPECADYTSFTLTVSEQPTAGIANDVLGCDDTSNDGFEEFDFSTQDASIYNGQSTTDFTVTYHTSMDDADTGDNALNFPYTNTTRAQIIYARIENAANTDCYRVSTFNIEVFARPTIANQGPFTICAGVAETIDAGPGFSSYLWSTGEVTQTIDVAAGGDYTVTVTNSDGCDSNATVTVVESDVARIVRVDVGQFEVNTNTLTAIVTGSGDYEFSLDDFVYQNSPRFNNLYPGFYTVYIKDKNGCGTVSMDAVIMGGPAYFTPNQDGYHDTWQVLAVETIPNATIYIFDRHGKLMKQISPTGQGWDGTYNGNPMPSSDYWYLVELADGRNFKGHFALKR